MTQLNIEKLRKDFPILDQEVNGHPLVYLDNAATTQKPLVVIEAINDYYRHYNANVHRGIHQLSEHATQEYEQSRAKLQHFINAKESRECVFVRGTTEAVNLVANSFVLPRIEAEEEILITHMEHHSNIVPWQMVCKKTGANLRVAPINDRGEVILEEFERMLTDKTKFVAINHISNALGTINPVKEMIHMAHERDILVLVDGAQAAPHMAIDVQDLDCDFYAISGHKMYGPTGIGLLYGRAALLDAMPPYQGGGEMISHVTFDTIEYKPIPYKFEAGTPNIVGSIAMGTAADYLSSLDLDAIHQYEQGLLEYATEALSRVKGLNMVGTAENKASICSFVMGTIHAHDIGTILNSVGVAVRAGHHCAMPVMDRFDVAATARASFAFYNTHEEVDCLVEALHKVREVFA